MRDTLSYIDRALFWPRPATPVLLYESRRDGRVVATTDGISHHFADLSSGRACGFEVVAIDRQRW